MGPVDVSGVGSAILEVISASGAVAASALMIHSCIAAFRLIRNEFFGSSDVVAGQSVQSQSADIAEYERRSDVFQSWESQSASGPGMARMNMFHYAKLLERGMDSYEAIGAIEARNASVARAESLQDAQYAAEHQSAIESSKTQELDLTVKVGGGWR